MRIITIITAIAVGILFCIPSPSGAMMASQPSQSTVLELGNKQFHLFGGVSLAVESGEMTYAIQGPEDGGWKSELIWPLDSIAFVGGQLSANFLNRWQVNAGVWKSIADKAGSLKDSDWFYSESPWLYVLYGDDKAVYGEFDTTVDAVQFDLNVRYDVVQGPTFDFGPLLGYAYKQWKWTSGEGYQTSPFTDFNVGRVTRTGIEYTEKIKIPYLGVGFSFLPQNSAFGLNLYALYSAIAQCDDVDDHILRYKESTGNTKGTFFSVGGDVLWKFKQPWSLSGKINYARYDLEGTQQQYFYGGKNPPPGTRFDDIDMTVTGRQLSFGLMIGYEL
jgi:outer membrane protease